MAFTLTSTAFTDGGPIPRENTCDGEARSPELRWSGEPEGTRSFVLIAHDPDAPDGDYTHWLVLDIPPAVHEFPEGAAPIQRGQEAVNSAGNIGYHGPCPPAGDGAHRYVFDLYALDTPHTGLGERCTRQEAESKIRGHILAHARLTGTYERR